MLNIDINSHKPLREIVYEELKKLILTGKITPGTRMMEVEMAEELGVSRTPVREAIRKLEREGLVNIEPRKGAYAASMTKRDMVDILEVRQTMEGLAAQFAAERMTKEQIEDLQKVSEDFNNAVKAGDMGEMIRQDTLFHHLIVEGTGNKLLKEMVEQLQELVLRFRYLYYDDFRRAEKMPDEHKEILEGIIKKDGIRARDAADYHIDGLKQIVISEDMAGK